LSGSPPERADRIRRGVGFFPDLPRGRVEVAGGDRLRWLNGMITADVAGLAPGAVAYSLQLDPKGRILAELYVLAGEEVFWLDTAADRVPALIAQLERYVIADDVTLRDVRADSWRASLEGPETDALLDALGAEAPAPWRWREARLGGAAVLLAGWGESGERAVQIFASPADAAAVEEAVRARSEVVPGDAATLEVLRIEAGTPRMGAELDEEVFPAEAGLVARAVSLTKGCFTGQEIVARIESRGAVNHHLVGLRFDGAPPPPGSPLALPDGKGVGEVTSSCSSSLGAIGLGYARSPHDAPGAVLAVAGGQARVVALPFVAPAA
jgi:aminomethyltransferase